MTTGSNAIPTTQTTPLRGTQSLVGVMSFVLKHPSLTALELLWRWLAAAPLLYLAWHTLVPTLEAIPLNPTALQSMTFFEPVRSAAVLARQFVPFRSPLEETGKWWIPLALLTWTAAATLGRTAVLHRAANLFRQQRTRVPPVPPLGPGFPERHGTPIFDRRIPAIAFYTLLRALAFLLLLMLWLYGLLAAVRSTVTHRIYSGGEPNLVLLTAEAVAITLAAFLLWSTTIWRLDLQPLQRITGFHPQTPKQTHQLRSKLMETNLVMGIVRVILLVLALTFSASPLPFQSRETQAYINVWWVGVAIFYIFGSDLFHVVRRLTYLRLLQSIATRTDAAASSAS